MFTNEIIKDRIIIKSIFDFQLFELELLGLSVYSHYGLLGIFLHHYEHKYTPVGVGGSSSL